MTHFISNNVVARDLSPSKFNEMDHWLVCMCFVNIEQNWTKGKKCISSRGRKKERGEEELWYGNFVNWRFSKFEMKLREINQCIFFCLLCVLFRFCESNILFIRLFCVCVGVILWACAIIFSSLHILRINLHFCNRIFSHESFFLLLINSLLLLISCCVCVTISSICACCVKRGELSDLNNLFLSTKRKTTTSNSIKDCFAVQLNFHIQLLC